MNFSTLLLILSSVSMSALAQIMLKAGVGTGNGLPIPGNVVTTALTMLINPWVMAGLATYAAGAVVWLFVLSRSDVSFAYPFVSLGFLLTMALGSLLLGEQINASRLLGTFLIFLGIVCVARS